MCPSGCGDELAINLDRRAGPAWRLYRTEAALTLFPSVWRDTGCESHFIIWRSRIYLFGSKADDEDGDRLDLWSGETAVGREVVLSALSPSNFEDVPTIADRLDALPWEVLMVCRQLVRDDLAIEGQGRHRTCFRRA
jgi:hypothetical protein